MSETDSGDRGTESRLRKIVEHARTAIIEDYDEKNPLARRKQIEKAADILVELYGGEALGRAKLIAERRSSTFSRSVLAEIERRARSDCQESR